MSQPIPPWLKDVEARFPPPPGRWFSPYISTEELFGIEPQVPDTPKPGISKMVGTGHTVELAKDKSIYRGHYLDVIDLVNFSGLKNQSNRDHQDSVLKKNDPWAGGTVGDLLKTPDMSPFELAKSGLSKTNFHRKITPVLSVSNRRKRHENPYDGDFNFDKRWDMTPFSSARRMPVRHPTISLEIDFSVNCGCSSEELDRYGVFVWSVCQLLESAGVSLSISLRTGTRSIMNNGRGIECFLKIKESGEYVSPTALAKVFRTVFYRRAMFNLWIWISDREGQTATPGLGSADSWSSRASYKNGVLRLSVGSNYDTPEVEKCLLEILTRVGG